MRLMVKELQLSIDHEDISGRRIVKKHVATIHCTNKLSLLERKISNALLFHAQPTLRETLIHEISLNQLKRLLNINTRNNDAIKQALKKLISTIIEWNILGEDVPEIDLEGWNASSILSSVTVNRGLIKYQYSELIKGLIIEPRVYGKINLIIQSRFKSGYSLALYENCARYRGLKYTKNFDFQDFRRLMGVEEGKYEIFRDFNRRVLMTAVNEINTCSDIRIDPEIRRKGRKIHSIMFHLGERAVKRRIGQKKQINNSDDILLKELEVWGIKSSQYTYWCKNYGHDNIVKQVNYIKSTKEYEMGNIGNLGGYLKTALEHDYKKAAPVLSTSKPKKPCVPPSKKRSYEDYTIDHTVSIFHALHPEKQSLIQSSFQAHYEQLAKNNLSREIILNSYNNGGYSAVKKEFAEFIQETFPQLVTGLKNIEEFLTGEVMA